MKRLSIFLFSSLALALSVSANVVDGVVRARIAGMDVLIDKTSVRDVVVIRGSWPAGDALAPASNPAIATLVAGMLDKGTTAHDKFALAKVLEDLGASIRFSAGDSLNAEFSVSCLKEDLPTVVALLAEELKTPAFDATEFGKFKQQLSAGMRRQQEDTNAQADRTFLRSVYPAGHPNHPAAIEEWLAGIGAATLADVKAFHAAHYGPVQMTVVAAGDIDVAGLQDLLQKSFGDWQASPARVPTFAKTNGPNNAPKEQTIVVPGKTSVSVILGQTTGVRYSDPDDLPLRVAASILGEGFTGRLMKQVREKEGLTYGIYASVNNDTCSDGDWQVTATFAPTLLDRGVASARAVVKNFLATGITPAELDSRKSSLVGKQQLSLSTTGGLANNLLATLQRGMPITWLDEYPQKIEALTVEQVNGAVQRHLSEDRMVLVKAGTLMPAAPAKGSTGLPTRE